jgi:hypothetical protein
MQTAENNPGVIDFQDAVWGPITYDLVSLLRDCYIEWPSEKINQWCEWFYQSLCAKKGLIDVSYQQFKMWFDLMGIQRHLKASGIFARLKHRDNKLGYMQDVPRTVHYIVSVAKEYAQLNDFVQLLDELDLMQRLELNNKKSTV